MISCGNLVTCNTLNGYVRDGDVIVTSITTCSQFENWKFNGLNADNTDSCSIYAWMSVAGPTRTLYVCSSVDDIDLPSNALASATFLDTTPGTLTFYEISSSGVNGSCNYMGGISSSYSLDYWKLTFSGTNINTSSTTSTTSSTTTLPAQTSELQKVETIILNKLSPVAKIDGSDSKSTFNSIQCSAFSFGTLAPGEISSPIIVYLKVPNASKIYNIKIALIDTGGMSFANNTFGVISLPYIDYNKIPNIYFTGVNTSNSPNAHYVSVNTMGNNFSEYVYLNITMPSNQRMGSGIVRYKWQFDYA